MISHSVEGRERFYIADFHAILKN